MTIVGQLWAWVDAYKPLERHASVSNCASAKVSYSVAAGEKSRFSGVACSLACPLSQFLHSHSHFSHFSHFFTLFHTLFDIEH